MAVSRQWVIDLLNRMGYSEAAEEASRVLPDQLDRKQLEEFGDRYGISVPNWSARWEAPFLLN